MKGLLVGLLFIAYSQLAIAQVSSVKIEGEAFTRMFGVINEPTTDVGGGQNVGSINTNDWIHYEHPQFEVLVAGEYRLDIRYASKSALSEFRFYLNDRKILIGSFIPKNTGGYQIWETASINVNLPVGKHNFYVFALSRVGDGTNFNWFTITDINNQNTLNISYPILSSRSSSSIASIGSSSRSSSSIATSSKASASASSSNSSADPNRPKRTLIEAGGKWYMCLYWYRPTKREGGQILLSNELQRYEIIIRDWYTRKQKFSVTVNHPQLFYEALIPFDYSGDSITVAAVDTNGLYSRFTEVLEQKKLPKPGCYSPVVSPINVKLK